MLLGAVSYGIFFLLTIQATIAILRRAAARQQKFSTQVILLSYVAITFILATLGFAGNSRYTEVIWIDMRDIPGGPPVLINTELNYAINKFALACYYIMEWVMSALLLYRTFIVWNRNIFVVLFMTSLFLGSVAMSILVLVESRIKDFYDINVQIAYLSLTVGTNILYTLLIVFKLFTAHYNMKKGVGEKHAGTYISIIAMIVESSAMYSVLGVLYIASFATHSNCSNLIFLSISHVQGIAQLLIILRVAEGRAYTGEGYTVQPNSGIVFGRGTGVSTSQFDSEGRATTVMGSGSALDTLNKKTSAVAAPSDSSREALKEEV
ncbi:hypothetical protein M422DRAFT_222413 [Sphaerobolus stellatus SS14]|nr:hypothetical protein M422DRAFT_222413 [Sphaerobolus stellatus SS14]